MIGKQFLRSLEIILMKIWFIQEPPLSIGLVVLLINDRKPFSAN